MSDAKVRIRRAARRQSFTVIDNRILAGGVLSLEATGLLAHLLSHRDDWTVTMGQLSRLHKIGRDKLQRIMGELRAAGYARLVSARDEDTGRLAGRVWVIAEESDPDETACADEAAQDDARRQPENPAVGEAADNRLFRQTEKPSDGKPGCITNTDSVTKTDSEQIPLPPRGGVERCASRKGEGESGQTRKGSAKGGSAKDGEDDAEAEARWRALKKHWPFDPSATPGDARAAFLGLSRQDQNNAIRYAPRYIAATEERKRKHVGNWIKARGWDDFVEQERVKLGERERIAKLQEEADERQRQKFGGVVILLSSQSHAAWARHDAARGIDCRREIRHLPGGQGYLRPTRWPPSSAAACDGQSARAGPGEAGAASGEARAGP